MSRQSELNLYIRHVQRRLRLGAWVRGAAFLMAAALITTLVLVLILNAYAFPAHGLISARLTLLLILGLAAAFALVLPIAQLSRSRSVATAEAARPELEQRLTTFAEREQTGSNPFLELLAADTLAIANHSAEPESLVPRPRLFTLSGVALGCLIVLAWMILAGPGYLGYGASLLWTGPKHNTPLLYEIRVKPGDVAVRRHTDQLITADIIGLKPDKVKLFARYESDAKAGDDKAGWEPVDMTIAPPHMSILPTAAERPKPKGTAYQFVFTGLPESVEYYVQAGPLTSPHYKVRVVDLPSVQQIQVTYHYPKWTGMHDVTEEHGGDLRALEGTEAEIQVRMDRPLKEGVLALDGGPQLKMDGSAGNLYHGTIKMEKDGAYHVAAMDQGQQVRLSEDYFISANKAQPPEIRIDKPSGDYRASPIEEVTVGVNAADEFGLNQVELHYSVNGGPDQKVNMLKSAGAKSADGSMTLRLEDFKLVPGDLVSLYATARDGHQEARTEMSFIQAEPFEREFSQSQQSGGGGGGGGGGQQGSETDISKREKELIAETWKQVNGLDQNGNQLDKAAAAKEAPDAGKFLSDVQAKLREQVLALSGRMQSRDLATANEEFTSFEKDMQVAAAAMVPAADKLKGLAWKDALPLEQKALQNLLRAEATFRQIEVAFGQRGGGGGGGGSAGRDLASLFDLELDTEKNQYETAQSASSPAEQQAKAVDDALAKLDALARRQEELAKQNPQNGQQSFEQRWQQEMLRREAERLEKQMAEMAQNQQQQQGQQGQSSSGQQGQQGQQSSSGGQSSGQSSSSQGGQAGQSSSQSSGQAGQQQQASQSGSSQRPEGSQGEKAGKTDPRVTQALNRLRQADESMKQGTAGNQQQTNEAAQRAAEQLRQAQSLLGGAQQQQASNQVESLSHKADQLGKEEKSQVDRMKALTAARNSSSYAGPTQGEYAERNQLAGDRQRMSDDLTELERGMRDAARSLAPNQPITASKLRDALNGMDQSDLGNRVQRTADWLRRGINPNGNGTEAAIGNDLQKLGEQLRQAQQGLSAEKQGQGGQDARSQAEQTAALDHVDKLRSEIESLARGRNGEGQQGQNGQNQQGQNQPGQSRFGQNQQGRQGQAGQQGQPSQQGGGGSQQANSQAGQASQSQGGGGRGGPQQRGNYGRQSGDIGGLVRNGGDVANGGGGRAYDGTVDYNVDTGGQNFSQRGARVKDGQENRATDGGITLSEQAYRQGLSELDKLRDLAKSDPEALKEVQDLVRQMQQLDPRRFAGNPEMVEQLHTEVLSGVDKLELELRRDDQQPGQVRTGKAAAIPAGYEDAVADYYRRLSNGNKGR